MHIASIGTGPVILFLHGFPELWYSWRHQLLYLSSLGYRCIAPDLRGYGDTDAPPSATSYTVYHSVGDLIGLLDHLGIDQVFLVAHDWGAVMAWYFCLFRPDRIKALVNLSVAFRPRHPVRKPLESFRFMFGDDYYICRFQVIQLLICLIVCYSILGDSACCFFPLFENGLLFLGINSSLGELIWAKAYCLFSEFG